jgi:hypothetical protein
VISNPSNGSFQWVREITPIGYKINKISGAKKMYLQKGVTDIDGYKLYFSSKTALNMHINSCRTEKEQVHYPGHPQQDLPLEKEWSYYPGYPPQDHPGYAPQDHPLAMPVHRTVSGVSPANLPNQKTPSSDMDCGLNGGGGVRE